MTNKQRTEFPDDDELIAKGLVGIREGILAGDWQQVVDSYNLLSGEELEVPTKPKSRIEKLREKIKEATEKVEPETTALNLSTATVKQLKEYLLEAGYKAKDFKGKNKAALIQLVKTPKDSQPVDEKPQLNEDYLTVQKIKGGTRFGNKGDGVIEIYSDPYRPDEAEKNKKVYRPRLPVKERVTKPREIKDEDAPFRYSDKNRRPE